MFTKFVRCLLLSLICIGVSHNHAEASSIGFVFSDPAGDQTGPIDLRRVAMTFDDVTGNYSILATASADHPFLGNFRLNFNLLNPDAPVASQFFQDNVNDYSLATATTALLLTGSSAMLKDWDAGDRVANNSAPFGVPPPIFGAGVFRSGVITPPFIIPIPEDNLTGPVSGSAVMGVTGVTQNLPVTPTARCLFQGCWVFSGVPTGTWFDPPLTGGFTYSMTSDSLFTSIVDFPVGFGSPFLVSVGGVLLGSFGPGMNVDFSGFPGGGVSAFAISGINPFVDGDDPTAFPLRLAFSTPTASFQMQAVSDVPEPASLLLLGTGVAGLVASRRRRCI